MINKGLGTFFFFYCECAPHIGCLLPMPASRHKFIRQEMWVCKCRSNKPQPTTTSLSWRVKKKNPFQANRSSCTSQGHCSSQMGLAAYSPSLRSYLQRLESSLCKPQAPAPEKKPGSSRRLRQEDGLAKCYYRRQMSRSFPHTCSICHHPIHALSLFLLSAHSSLPVSLTQSQSISLARRHLLSRFVSCVTDSFVTLSLFRFSEPFRPSEGTSVRATYHHHQSQYHSEDVRCRI